MLTLGALGCALTCLAAGLATPRGFRRDQSIWLLAAVQIVGGGLLAWLIGWLVGLTPDETAALVLIGVAPGSVAASALVVLAGGAVTFAEGMAAVGGFGALLATAVVAGRTDGEVFTWLLLAAALPTWAGLRLRGRLPDRVNRAMPILAGLVLGAMILAALVLGTAGASLWPLGGAVLVMAIAFAVLGNAAGRVLNGAGAGTAAAIALPMRNVAVPMLAGFSAGMPAVPLAAAMFGIAMYVPAVAVVFARISRNRRR